MSKEQIIEERLNKVVELLESSATVMERMDIQIPMAAQKIVNELFHSKEIQSIITDVNTRRPPKIILMGRSGVGKSSLINAMFGTYLAETSAIEVGTVDYEIFQYYKSGRLIFEIIDTRGTKENINEQSNTALEELVEVLERENPDAFLFLTNGADRSTLKEDAADLNRLYKKMEIAPPLITVITRVDEIEPSRIKKPEEYSAKKINYIKEKELQVRRVLHEAGLKDSFIVPVSSYIEWSHEEPETLTEEEREKLEVTFDGRYNIEKLLSTLEENMDFNVAIDLMFHHRLDKALEKIATIFVKRLAAVSGAVGTSPMPVADVFVLLPIQIIEVTIIAYLSGTTIDSKAAREFIISLGAVFLFGFGLRFVAQQGTKLLNVIPGAGSTISGSIAASGTYSIGKAAIAYYINESTVLETKRVAEQAKLEMNQQIYDKQMKEMEQKLNVLQDVQEADSENDQKDKDKSKKKNSQKNKLNEKILNLKERFFHKKKS